MPSHDVFGKSLDKLPERDEIFRAQLESLARHTPTTSAVTAITTLMVLAMLWPAAPRPWLIGWAGAQLILIVTTWLRWRKRRFGPLGSSRASLVRGLRRARRRATVSGLLWGSIVGFFPYVSERVELGLIIVVAALAAGASTTLSAVPRAAGVYILGAILPMACYFALQGDVAMSALAALALVMTLALLASARTVYGAVLEELRAHHRNSSLLEQFRSERQEWLDISETTEAFALFDEHDRLLLWNENYRTLLSVPSDRLQRGAARMDLLRSAARPVAVERGDVPLDQWVAELLALHERPDRPVIHELSNGRWIRSSARRLAGHRTVTVHVDVTELKRAQQVLDAREAEIREMQKLEAVGQLAGGVAHDFNNLLTAIIGYTDLLIEELADRPEHVENAREIRRAADRAAALTRQLLAFGRKQTLAPRRVDPRALVADMEQMLRRLVPESIDLVLVLPAEVGSVVADPTQLERVVLNLVINARDATSDGGAITIRVGDVDIDEQEAGRHADVRPGPYVRISVEDTGMGIDAETRAHLFEPFYTTKGEGRGTGLGLSTVYGIVRQSGGWIRVLSALGRGATFEIYLPRTITDAAAPNAELRAAASSSGTETVLVVEDEDVVRSLVRDALQSRGYQVLEASRPVEAVRMCERYDGRIDLILTDVVMPEMSGRALIARVADHRPDARVLYMSGHSAEVIDTHGMIDESAPFLQKPFSPEQLARLVRATLDGVEA